MKQFKKIMAVMILLTFIVGGYGCGIKSPSNTVKDYLEQVKKGENGNVKQFLGAALESKDNKDEAEKKENKFSDETSKKFAETMQKLTYTINSESINGDSATVNVKVNGPDMSNVMGEFMKKALSTAFSQAFAGKKASDEENNKQYESIFVECLKDVTYADRTGDISLKKVDGQWEIATDESLQTLVTGVNWSALGKKKTENTDAKK